jgi:hypothetical protein
VATSRARGSEIVAVVAPVAHALGCDRYAIHRLVGAGAPGAGVLAAGGLAPGALAAVALAAGALGSATGGSAQPGSTPPCAHWSVTSFEQSATHCAATFAVQAVCALTEARSAHPIFASTPHVALHWELHWSWHDDAVVDLQFEPHALSHCEPQYCSQSLTTSAAPQIVWHRSPQRSLQAEVQSALAPALHSRSQCEPQSVRQLPLASASQLTSKPVPTSAWQAESMSICAHANGHASFA